MRKVWESNLLEMLGEGKGVVQEMFWTFAAWFTYHIVTFISRSHGAFQ